MIAIIVVRSSLYQLVLYNTAQHPSSTNHYIFLTSYKYVLGCSSMWHWFIGATQVNATLLAVSLVSLAKSQCGKVGGKKDKEQTEQYLEVGKWVTVGKMHWMSSFYTPLAIVGADSYDIKFCYTISKVLVVSWPWCICHAKFGSFWWPPLNANFTLKKKEKQIFDLCR